MLDQYPHQLRQHNILTSVIGTVGEDYIDIVETQALKRSLSTFNNAEITSEG